MKVVLFAYFIASTQSLHTVRSGKIAKSPLDVPDYRGDGFTTLSGDVVGRRPTSWPTAKMRSAKMEEANANALRRKRKDFLPAHVIPPPLVIDFGDSNSVRRRRREKLPRQVLPPPMLEQGEDGSIKLTSGYGTIFYFSTRFLTV